MVKKKVHLNNNNMSSSITIKKDLHAPAFCPKQIARLLKIVDVDLSNFPFLKKSNPDQSILALHPTALGSILGIPKNFSLEVAELY